MVTQWGIRGVLVANHNEMAFFHGTMGSRKTLELMIDHYRSAEDMDHETLIIKPGRDLKAGTNIQTRAFRGAELAALVMPEDAEATEFVTREMARSLGAQAAWTIYLDEVNFFEPEQIMSLRSNIVDTDIADVNMYGLLTDAFGNFFPGSETALKYADRIIQLDKTCGNKGCDRLAIRNARTIDGKLLREGPQVAIEVPGVNYLYLPICHKHYQAGVVQPQIQE